MSKRNGRFGQMPFSVPPRSVPIVGQAKAPQRLEVEINHVPGFVILGFNAMLMDQKGRPKFPLSAQLARKLAEQLVAQADLAEQAAQPEIGPEQPEGGEQ